MGPQEDYIETVFTCEGDINDPNLHSRLEDFQSRLRELLSTDKRKLILKKVEPWNSVRVTFNIPREAAWRLKQLAQQGNVTLRQLGVLAVQIEGDQLISLTIAGRNNERTQLIFRTADDTVDAPNLSLIDSGGSTNDFGSPGPTNVQSTRKNIAEYLRQGAGASIFDSIFPTQDNDIAQSVSSIATGRTPNLPLHNPNFPPDRNISTASLHNVSQFSGKAPAGNAFHNFQAEYEQNRTGPYKPPPPYPEGSAWFNNVAKGIRGLPPTTSPLLVNLLQTEPSLAAGMNNFINSKMLPPPPDSSPPLKKKRKPRKPKDKTEGEATIQSFPNPVLSTYSLPVTGSYSNTLPSPMVTQALAANTQPLVTFSKTVPSSSEMLYVPSVGEEFHDKGKLTLSPSCKALSKVSKGIMNLLKVQQKK